MGTWVGGRPCWPGSSDDDNLRQGSEAVVASGPEAGWGNTSHTGPLAWLFSIKARSFQALAAWPNLEAKAPDLRLTPKPGQSIVRISPRCCLGPARRSLTRRQPWGECCSRPDAAEHSWRLTTVGGAFFGKSLHSMSHPGNALLTLVAKVGTTKRQPHGQAWGRLGIYLLASSSALEKLPNHSSRYPSRSSA